MTKEEILAELEAVKELTNDAGKRSLDGIKAAVKAFRTVEEAEAVFVANHPLRTEETLDVVSDGHELTYAPKVVSKPQVKPVIKKTLSVRRKK